MNKPGNHQQEHQQYPHGKLGDDDQGAGMAGVRHQDGRVILNFGKPIAWIGMTPEEAITLGRLLVRCAIVAAAEAAHAQTEKAP